MGIANPVVLAEVLARGDIWSGGHFAIPDIPGRPTGWAVLDAALPGGGWPRGALVELLGDAEALDALSLLLPALAHATQAGEWALMAAPPQLPHAPAWVAAGVDLRQLMLVDAPANELPWVCDQSLRAGTVSLLLAWLPVVSPALLRRLQVSTAEGGACGWVFRPLSAARQASPAPLRLICTRVDSGLAVTIPKRRGHPLTVPLELPLARPGMPRRNAAFSHALACPVLSPTAARRAAHPTAA